MYVLRILSWIGRVCFRCLPLVSTRLLLLRGPTVDRLRVRQRQERAQAPHPSLDVRDTYLCFTPLPMFHSINTPLACT